MFKKFIFDTIKFLSPIILICLILIFFPANIKNQAYLNSYTDKINQIKEHKEKSIILIGGSNLAFGIDSRMLEDSLGFRVINFGLQASLGLIYQIDKVEKYVKPNDIIILVPEYYQYINYDAWGTGSTLAKAIMYNNPSDLMFLRPIQMKQVLPYLINESIGKLKRWHTDDSKNERKAFNSNGDFIGHLKMPNREINKGNYNIESNISNSIFSEIKKFETKMSIKNVNTFLMFPVFPQKLYELNIKPINLINERIFKSSIKTIGSADNYLFSDSNFFEYPHHLNAESRIIRTKRMIKDLKQNLSAQVHSIK
jgi:hypothetical protein